MLPWKNDTVLALLVLTLGVAGTYGRMSSSGLVERPIDSLGLTLIVVSSVTLVWRRRSPLAAGGVTAACAVAYYGCQYPGVFAAAPALIMIYTAASLGRRRPAIVLAVVLAAGIGVVAGLSAVDPAPGGLSLLSGWLVAVVVFGEVARNRRAYLHEVEQRAIEAERTRDEAALRRAGEERLWIAQELHDALTHTISVINVQTSVALELLDRDPSRTRTSLMAIKESGHEAMRELRSTLGVLRQPESPSAGLDRLPALIERAEAVGLSVRSTVTGEPGELRPETDRAAYRIAQEAFTNVLRHAGPATITLTVSHETSRVIVTIADDGTPGDAEPGMGLIGMRERAVAVGGTLAAGPAPSGGFLVRAELPR
ncbi:sensor histidine kinase [Herbidospora mongoliensis]|uniref:sensor histidine kinase n=1 Tax=Herbidospora mongoliensis TaxID=688067 RepID=UPI0012F7D9A5|nr:sensor histidine kinase [Herbidospora mongoliensis]